MATYSSSKDINTIATNYAKLIKGGKDSDYALGGFVGDMEIAKMNSAASAAEAEKQRAYETQMSNTAYQRSVLDLEKSGLNPILAAMNGGSSTPSTGIAAIDTGATGSGSKLSENAVNAIVSRQNAQLSAQAQMNAAAMSASAARYAADKQLEAIKYQIDHPQTYAGILQNALGSTTDDGSSGGFFRQLVSNVKDAYKVLTGQMPLSDYGKGVGSQSASSVAHYTSSGSVAGGKGGIFTPYVKYSTSTAFTQKTNKSKSINQVNIEKFNSAYKASLKIPYNNQLKYDSFKSYSQYLDFCQFFNFSPVYEKYFNSLKKNRKNLFA